VEAVAQSRDGVVYALVTNYAGGNSLQAFTLSGRRLWKREDPGSTLLVGRGATIYTAGTDAVAADDPAGRLLWRRGKADGALALAERTDGVVLVAGARTLTAVTPQGKRQWTVQLQRKSGYLDRPSLIVDSGGTAYVGTADGYLLAVGRNGRSLWRLRGGGYHYGFSPTSLLDATGSLLVDGTDNVLRVYGP
jgi:outer membrane protein assembly factor BamB